MAPILSKISWTDLAPKIRAETKNRECHQPLVSTYRWWARRPHALMGAILEAASESLQNGGGIADPFSGGGTVAIEAVRRSLTVYAQDVNPWATWGLRTSLTRVDPDELAAAGDLLLSHLRARFDTRYSVAASSGARRSHVHTFRVRTLLCSVCGSKVWMFPYPLITLASRAKIEKEGFFGCRACGSVNRQTLNCKNRRCSVCITMIEVRYQIPALGAWPRFSRRPGRMSVALGQLF